MKNLYLSLIAFLLYNGLHAQIQFQKYFTMNNSIGELYRSVLTPDGGYAAVGHLTNLTNFENDFLIIKVDSAGNALWIKEIATAGIDEEFTDLVITSDGNLVVTGSAFNVGTFTSNGIVAKFDMSGTLLWTQSFTTGGGGSVTSRKIQADTSGHLFVMGDADVASSTDYFIMELDSNGTILQQNSFGTPDQDYAMAFLRNSNGDFFISGWDNTGAGENIHLIKIDPSMTVAWSLIISGPENYFCYDLRENLNGDILLAGRYDDGINPYNLLLSSIDRTGNILWANYYLTPDTLRGYAYGLTANNITHTIAVTGIIEDSTAGTLILETDSLGNVNWSERIGSTGMGEFGSGYGITTTDDGGYLVTGPRSDLNNSTVQLIKTDSLGHVACNGSAYMLTASALTLPSAPIALNSATGNLTGRGETYTPLTFAVLDNACQPVGIPDVKEFNFISVSPCPFRDEVSVSIPGDNKHRGNLTIYNVLGQPVFHEPDFKTGNNYTKQINLNFLPAGIYLVDIDRNGTHHSKKIVKE